MFSIRFGYNNIYLEKSSWLTRHSLQTSGIFDHRVVPLQYGEKLRTVRSINTHNRALKFELRLLASWLAENFSQDRWS